MARIIVCDYLKRSMRPDEPTFVLSVDGKEFEVCQEAKNQLIELLEADELPAQPTIQVAPPAPVAPSVQAAPAPAPTPLINVETTGDPFGGDPGSAAPPPPPVDPVQLEIPDDPLKRLGMPSQQTWEKVMEEAKKFEPGTLASLTPGAGRKVAGKRLREVEEEHENSLRRQGGSSINVNDNYRNSPGFRSGE